EAVGGAVVVHAVAVLGDVAYAGRATAGRRALHVWRTGAARSGTGLLEVADAARGATDLAARAGLTAAGAAPSRAAAVGALVALLAARPFHAPVAAQGDEADGHEVAVVRLHPAARPGIIAGALAAVRDREAQADGAFVAAGEEAVRAAAARGPGESQRM